MGRPPKFALGLKNAKAGLDQGKYWFTSSVHTCTTVIHNTINPYTAAFRVNIGFPSWACSLGRAYEDKVGFIPIIFLL